MTAAGAWSGKVEAIHVADGRESPMRAVESVEAVAGRGLDGDRYYDVAATSDPPRPDRQVTLVEAEALEGLRRDYGIDLPLGDSRRNITTRGVALNHLVDREFMVGGARLRGVKLCEPCEHLERLTGLTLRPGLKHRGGLRCEILAGGTLRVGDLVSPA
ncbi:MAG TPA: MOSC domain-containing protein [Candidatus Dormibacteraeota bacterium]|jgi:MOSC domain-containing protein YiiM|nr:MOSC domain-containing protein [Candidatus Dormibacteraeota bacterium]